MEISLGEAITMTARNKPDAPSFVFSLDSHRYVEIVLAALKRELRTRD